MQLDLDEMPALVLDCQTSGATPKSGAIIELAWCLTTAKRWQQALALENIQGFMVRLPEGERLSSRIAKLTGISADDLASKRSITRRKLKKLLKEVISSEALGQKPLFAVAHFAGFEKRFLDDLFGKKGFPIPLVCTHQIARKIYPTLPSKGLRGVAGFLEWPSSQGDAIDGAYLKRAHAHVDATCWIWKRLCQDLVAQKILSLDNLGQWLALKASKRARKREYAIDSAKRLALPDKPGIYRMLNSKRHIIYIGKATSLRSRVNSYFRGQRGKHSRLLEMVTQVRDIDVTVTETEIEAALLENDEIKSHNPPYNVALKNVDQRIVFLSRDLTTICQEYSPATPLGPFPGVEGPLLIEQLFQAIHTPKALLVPQSFLDHMVEPDMLGDGLLLFLQQQGLSRDTIKSRRQLLAKGMLILREHERMAKAQALLNPEEDEQEEEDPQKVEWSVELVADSFKNALRHAAQVFCRSKGLLRLTHAVVGWETKNKRWRLLAVNQSKIVERFYSDDIEAFTATSARFVVDRAAHFALTKLDYDRLRILRTELQSLRRSGLNVRIF